MPARRLIITGKVQGVFYRANAKKEADMLGLKGWVRNMDAGSVEAHIEGTEEAVKEFITWAHRGSEMSEVASVSVKEYFEESLTTFDVVM